jgi:cob(I)alamin adenosyltransferase
MAETDVLLKLKFDISEAEKQLENLKKEVKDMGKDSGSKASNDITKNYEKQIENLTKQVEDLHKQLEEFSNSSIKAPEIDTSDLQREIEEVSETIQETLNEVTDSEPIQIPINFDDDGLLAQSRRLQQEVYQILTNGRPVTSSTMQGLLNQMKQTALEAEHLTQHLEELSQIDVAGNQTNDYNELRQNLNSAVDAFNALNEAREQATESGQTEFQGMTLSIEEIDAATDELVASIEVLSDRIRSIEGLDRVNGQLAQQTMRYRELSETSESTFSDMTSDVISYASTVYTVIRQVVGVCGRFFTTLYDLGTRVVRGIFTPLLRLFNVVRQLPKLLSQIIGKFKLIKANNPFKGLLRNILRYGLGITSLVVLFNRLRNNITSNFKDVIAKSNEAKTAYENLQLSIGQLSHQITAIFEPVLRALEPLLTLIIDKLTQAAFAVTQFIGAISGQSKVLKAKKNLNALANAAKNANEQLSGFDKLNVLTTQKDSGAGDANWYDWADVDPKYLDLWEKIKDTWAQDQPDFSWLGRMIADKLSDMMENIPWNDIFKIAYKSGFSFATFLNGFFTDEDDELSTRFFDNIGRTFANGINTLIYAVQGFIEGFKFDVFGQALGSGFVTAINNIDWHNLAWNIIDGLKGALSIVSNFLNTISDKENGIDVATIRDSIQTTIIGIFNDLSTFVNETDWGNLTDKIIEFFSFDADEIASSVANFINTLKDKDIIKNFKDVLFSILGDTESYEFSAVNKKNIGGENKGLAGFINQLITDTDIDGLIDDVTAFLIELFQKIGLNMGDILVNLTENIDPVNLANDIDRVVKSFIDSIGLAFGLGQNAEGADNPIHEWLKELLDNIDTASLCDELVGVLGLIMDLIPWDEVEQILIPVVMMLLELGSGLLNNILLPGFRKWLSEKLQGFKPWLAQKFENFKSWLAEKIQGFIPWIGQKIGNIINKILEKWNELKDKSKEKFDLMRDNIVNSIDGIKNKIRTPINNIIGFFESMVNSIIAGINFLTSCLNNLSFEIPAWVGYIPGVPKELAGATIGFQIPQLSSVSIPRLAQGAVIPPNKEFLAMLGDQKSGTNIEAPLDTIKQAFMEVMQNVGNGNQEIVLQLDGREFMRAMIKQNNELVKMTGNPAW